MLLNFHSENFNFFMENIEVILQSFLSSDNDIRNGAKSFLIEHIMKNPDFFIILFQLYNNSEVQVIKKLSLILIKCIISMNFQILEPKFQIFSENLEKSLLSSTDTLMQKLFVGIVFELALKIGSPWPDFAKYLMFYTNGNYLHFSILLFRTCILSPEINEKYGEILNQVQPQLTLAGINSPDLDVAIMSSYLFVKCSKGNLIENYQAFIGPILTLAQNSLNFSENQFNSFWSAILNINAEVSEPLFNMAKKFIAQNDRPLSGSSKMVLYRFLFTHSQFIQISEVQNYINGFITAQIEYEDIDHTGLVFTAMYKKDVKLTFSIFLKVFESLLSSGNPRQECAALEMIGTFTFIYKSEIMNHIEAIVNTILQIAPKSRENMHASINSLKNMLEMVGFQTIAKLFEFFFRAMFNCPFSELQSDALECFRPLDANPVFFNLMIDSFASIQPELYPLFFSCLAFQYTVDVNLANVKYEGFIDLVINIFVQTSKQVVQATNNFTLGINEINQELVLSLLIHCGSAANLLLYFSFYNPGKLNGMIPVIIKNHLCMAKYIELCELSESGNYGIMNVFDDFSIYCNLQKKVIFNFLHPFYNEIVTSPFITNEILIIFIENIGMDCSAANDLVEDFIEKANYINKMCIDQIAFFVIDTLPSIAKIMYKIPKKELYQSFFFFLLKALNFAMNAGILYPWCQSLKNIARPKAIRHNQNVPWFPGLVQKTVAIAAKVCTEIVPKYDKLMQIQTFAANVELMQIFINAKSIFGHEYFAKVVVPIYKSSPEATEDKILEIVEKMLIEDYCTQEEFVFITNLAFEIVKRQGNSQKALCAIFGVIYYLPKKDPKIANIFVKIASDLFAASLNDPSQIDPRCVYALFLLECINISPQEFIYLANFLPQIFAVFPISEKYTMSFFVDEMFVFIDMQLNGLPREIVEPIFAAIVRYFGMQEYAKFIFKIDDAKHAKLLKALTVVMGRYGALVPNFDVASTIAAFLPEQPRSVQYVLSLIQANN